MLQKATDAKNTTVEAEGLESIQLAVMASLDDKGISTISLAKNLSEINGLTDINNQVITEDTVLTLPKSVKLNNTKYYIKKDGTVIINNSILPDEYKPVEYIESSGTQYINTLVKGNENVSYEIKAKTKDKTKMQILFGNRASATDSNLSTIFPANTSSATSNNNNEGINDFGTYQQTRQYYVLSDILNSICTFYNNKDERKIYLNGELIITTSTKYTGTFAHNNLDLYIGYKDNGFLNTHYNFIGNIYFCKIWDNGDLVRDMVPCRESNNVVGLYDTVEGKFYTNQGSGTFGYGMEDGTYVAPTNN